MIDHSSDGRPDVDVLLIGGGIASTACAVELRVRGFSGSVMLVGRESDPPYHRPRCSKESASPTGSGYGASTGT